MFQKVVAPKLFAWKVAVRGFAMNTRRRLVHGLPFGAIQGRSSGVNHVGLPAGDLDLAERFYVGLLGGEVDFKMDREFIARQHPERLAEIANEPGNIFHLSVAIGNGPTMEFFRVAPEALGCAVCALPEARRTRDQTHPHVALWVSPGDLGRWSKLLTDAGIPIQGPVRQGPPGAASVFFNDPFGNHIELSTLGYLDEVNPDPVDTNKLVYDWQHNPRLRAAG